MSRYIHAYMLEKCIGPTGIDACQLGLPYTHKYLTSVLLQTRGFLNNRRTVRLFSFGQQLYGLAEISPTILKQQIPAQ